MPRIPHFLALLGLLAPAGAYGQVLSPPEILDARLRELQQKHFSDLKRAAAEMGAHSFPYRLCFSRTLDLDEEQQRRSDQRSIRFDKMNGQTVLAITANYFASYSAELMSQEERARRTLHDVITPILTAAIPAVADEAQVESFAVEIAHHVRRKVLGVTHENPENVALVLPAAAARQLMAAATPDERESALLQGQLFVNRQAVAALVPSRPVAAAAPLTVTKVAGPSSASVPRAAEVSPDMLQSLQTRHQADLDRLVRELDQQAHFVAYAPPAFIAFRHGAYLQLSVKTTLPEAPVSQYQLAALAFDEHIAHLIRPVLAALKTPCDFEGIDFSTSVGAAGAPGGNGTAVEFLFTAESLSSYRNFDLTGQGLIQAGVVLINGERVGLELQAAEAVRGK